MKLAGKVGGALLALAFLVGPANASVINMGVDIDAVILPILPFETVTVLPFYNGAGDGGFFDAVTVPPTRNITINTAAVFGSAPIVSATLWVNASGVDFIDNIHVFANGVDLGALVNDPAPSPIPLIGGGYVNAAGESDNTIFTLPAALVAQLQTDTTFQVTFQRVGLPIGSADVHGFNIQAVVPEPASVTLLGVGMLSMIGYAWRRRRERAA